MNTSHPFEFLNIEIENIEYYTEYKNNLCQFIIRNGSYKKSSNLHNRQRIVPEDMRKILKEIQDIEILIYKLKYEKYV
jgi:predicted metal-binding transcription factor (methanogenesis marker protein 9)